MTTRQSTRLSRRPVLLAGAALGALLGVPGAHPLAFAAAVHEVRMVNRGEAGAMVFEPRLLHVEPGATVRFVPVDRGHSVESIPGMAPEGGPSWKGSLNEEVVVTLDVEGVYGVLCRPHHSMGMVALIVVGDPSVNFAAAKQVTHRGRARTVFAALFQELEAIR